MDKFMQNLGRQVEGNPLGALVAASMAMNAITKLMRVHHEGINARAWAKEVARREKLPK